MTVTDDWAEVRLSDVIRRAFSGPSPTCEERNIHSNEWGVLKTTCSTWTAGWDSTKHKVLPPEFWGKSHLEVQSGDSIITKAGPRHRVAVPAFVSEVQPRIIPSGKMICLRPDPSKIEPGFLALALSDRRTQSYLDQRTTGMAESQVNFENADLLGAPLWIPSLDGQRRILEPLNSADRMIATLETLIVKKQAIKQGMMQQLLAGKTRLPGFTEPWSDASVGSVAAVTMGQSPPGSSYNTDRVGTPLVQGNADIRGRSTVDRIWTTAPTKRCAAGDVLLTVRAPVGYTAVASRDCCLGRGVGALSAGVDNRFLFHALVYAEPKWMLYEQGSTFTAVNSNEVRAFELAWPTDRAERVAIGAALDDADAELRALRQRLTKARGIKQGMMQELLTGRTRLPVEAVS